MTPITREESKKKIAELIERFERNYESYKNASYNETQVRREFIDPLFKALGWDIDNEQGIAEAYKEVIHEDRVKVDDETKAPDYCFTVYGQKKFFVEAKKPSVKIKEEIPPAYQVRRYGWSAKLAVSIVTDFEEFAVYDCTKKPAPADKAAVARIEYFTYKDYAAKHDFLWDTFSKEGVLKGNLDRYLSSEGTKKGTAAVDREFLKSMDGWRVELATNIALRNGALSEADINHAVQLIIDRLIFLRICEDREIEAYGAIRDAAGKNNCYKGLSSTFIAADQKYNSGLFNFTKDTLTPSLVIDDKTIKKIIDEMYYPACPYQFAAMPVEILGNAYEQFLGKTITFKRKTKDGHSVEIEEKPEVRKAGGVYYTPQYIVDYIVKHTVGELLSKDGMTPEKAAELKILDPACGSGSFLLGAYQYLLDWHLEYYRTHDGRKKGKSAVLTPDGRLATHEKKRILLNNLFGVDIDAQAVEVTKLSLLLKCLEGETNASITEQVTLLHERVLPTLDANIKCGNSLIGPDYFTGKLIPDDEELRRVNPFDWKREFPAVFMPSSSGSFSRGEKEGKMAEGFDCVIGNPPYGAYFSENDAVYFERYAVSKGVKDVYSYFVELSMSRLCKGGKISFIIPSAWLGGPDYKALREFILAHTVEKIVLLPFDVFQDAYIDTLIYVGSEQQPSESHEAYTYVYGKKDKITSIDLDSNVYDRIFQNKWNATDDNKIILKVGAVDILGNITSRKTLFFDDVVSIKRGVLFNKDLLTTSKASKDSYPYFEGDVYRYEINLVMPKWIEFNDKMKERPREFVWFKDKRILLRRLVNRKQRLMGMITESTFITNKNLYSVILKDLALTLETVLGVLNSRVVSFLYINQVTQATKDDFPQVTIKDLLALPFPIISESKQCEIKDLVDRMLDLHKKKADAKSPTDVDRIERMIASTDDEIDRLVYELYGLTEEEIGIVEGK